MDWIDFLSIWTSISWINPQEDVVFEHIGRILKKHGTLKESNKKRFSLFYLLSYEIGRTTSRWRSTDGSSGHATRSRPT